MKNIYKAARLALWTALLSSSGTAFAAQNLALGRAATATSISHFDPANFAPKKAVDSDATVASRWAADVYEGQDVLVNGKPAKAPVQSIEIDLGQTYRISSVVVSSGRENGYGRLTAFRLQSRASTGVAPKDIPGGSASGITTVSRTVSFTAVDARYLTVVCGLSTDDKICRIYDLKIMGDAIPAANTPPKAAAGADQSIQLPTNSVTLSGSGSDVGGTIAGYAWSKVSGGAAVIASPAAAKTAVSGLVAGTYVFRLTVKDNAGATGSDDVSVVVKPKPSPSPSPSPTASPKPSPSPSPSPKPSPKPSPSPSPTPKPSASPSPTAGKVFNVGTGSGELSIKPISGMQCGDTIAIKAGVYKGVTITDIAGCAGKPIVITNSGGEVKLDGSAQGTWGFELTRVHHVVVRSATAGTYGFVVDNRVGRDAVVISQSSEDVDVSGFHVLQAAHGFAVKTDPSCSVLDHVAPTLIKNVKIHDNLIENTLYEGMYLGYYDPAEVTLNCSGVSKVVKAQRLSKVEVYKNTLKNTGNEALKLRLCLDGCDLHDNRISGYGVLRDSDAAWCFGITVGSETYSKIYGNVIDHGYCSAIDIRSDVTTPFEVYGNNIDYSGVLPDGRSGASWAGGILFNVLKAGQQFSIHDNVVNRSNGHDVEVANYAPYAYKGTVCSSGSDVYVTNGAPKLQPCP